MSMRAQILRPPPLGPDCRVREQPKGGGPGTRFVGLRDVGDSTFHWCARKPNAMKGQVDVQPSATSSKIVLDVAAKLIARQFLGSCASHCLPNKLFAPSINFGSSRRR